MSKNNKQFKKTTAYKVIVVILLVLYVGYQLWAPSGNEQDGNVDDFATATSEMATSEVATDERETPETEILSAEDASEDAEVEIEEEVEEEVEIIYTFRSDSLWESHYEKHGIEMGFADKEEYLQAANAVLLNADTLHKTEAEDGDDVYYLEETNEFVVISTDGYLRTYFYPSDGIDYFNRQ